MLEELQRQLLIWNRDAIAEKLAASGVERFDVPLLVIYLGEMDVCGLLADVLRDHGASAVRRCFAEVLAGDPSRNGPEQVPLSEVDAERPVARLSVALVYLMALKCPSEDLASAGRRLRLQHGRGEAPSWFGGHCRYVAALRARRSSSPAGHRSRR